MANLPKYTDKDFRNEGHEVDFDLKRVYDMPGIEVSNTLALNMCPIANDLLLCELRQMP